MARLNLTLDEGTFAHLTRDAKRCHKRVATHARQLLREVLERHEQEARWRRWEAGYRADRSDARRLLGDVEGAQLELVGDEDA